MIHPGSLIRWGALGTVVLLVRAVVREAQAQRSPVILLPPADGGVARRESRRRDARPRWPAQDMAAEPGDEAPDEAGAATGPVSGPGTAEAKPARE